MKILIFTILIFVGFDGLGQLQGDYTVGQQTDDFPTIENALNEILTNGTNGNVHFLISPGVYQPLIITEINPSGNDSILISAVPESVLFSFCSLENSSNISFFNIRFEKDSLANHNSTVQVTSSSNINFLNCIIHDNSINSQAAINLANSNNILIFGTTLFSHDGLYQGSGSLVNSIRSTQGSGEVKLINDTIYGSLHIPNNKLYIGGSVLYSDASIVNNHNSSFIDNSEITFYSSAPENVSMTIKELKNSKIYGNTKTITFNVFNLFGNLIETSEIYHLTNSYSKIIKNEIHGATTCLMQINIEINGNIFYDSVYLFAVNNSVLMNNFFLDATFFDQNEYLDLIGNNFSNNSRLYYRYNYGGKVINNNINHVTLFNLLLPSEINSNNYFDLTEIHAQLLMRHDKNPTNYSPDYIDNDTNLHIQNPALFNSFPSLYSYVNSFTLFEKDFDLEERSEYFSVGADESCLTLPLSDTIELICGTNYVLQLCDSINSNYSWLEGANLLNAQFDEYYVHVDTIKSIYLLDGNAQIIDSIIFKPKEAFPLSAMNLNVNCDEEYQLKPYGMKNTACIWSPVEPIVSYIGNQIVTIKTNHPIQMLATFDNIGCESYTDTFNINVIDIYPVSIELDNYECDSIELSVQYYPCYDSILWDFDDGTYGSGRYVNHAYADDEMHLVTCYIWYNNEIDTLHRSVWMPLCLGIDEITANDYFIFPNPTLNSFKIQGIDYPSDKNYIVKVKSIDGKIIQTSRAVNPETSIELTNTGAYFVELYESNKLIKTFKVIRV